MKVLIVSYSFPPENVIGAVRVGKFAKYLRERGHEIRVLAAPSGVDRSLRLEVPEEHVIYAKDSNIDSRFDPLVALIRRLGGVPSVTAEVNVNAATGESPHSRGSVAVVELLRKHYYALLRIPDSRAGWRKSAISAGRSLLARWRPDLIFASSPPTMSLFVAAALGKRFRIPWIAELRDLWTDNPYYSFPAWRRVLDRFLERRVLNEAASLVTVTAPWARTLESNYDKPVSVVLNGFAEEDSVSTQAREAVGGALSLLYTGNVYRGYRDPAALFAAIEKLTSDDRVSIAVDFYGPSVSELHDLVERRGVGDCVKIHGSVTYRESLQLQRSADVLLLLQWNDPRDTGNIPAKFFEYIAAERPILMLGYEDGVLAQMIRDRKAGLVSNDPVIIAGQLSAWIAMRRKGGVPGLDPSAKAGLSRREQFEKLETVLAYAASSAQETS